MRRDQALALLRTSAPDLRAEFGVTWIGIFGSVARDEAREDSDVDVMVDLERPLGLIRLEQLRSHLERVLGARVDLGVRGAAKPHARARIERELVDAA